MADKNLTDETRKALELAASGLPPELQEAEQAQIDEWGEWVATQDIYFGGVRALNKGDAVPKSNVELYKYDQLGWVARRTTKAAAQALTEAAPAEGKGN